MFVAARGLSLVVASRGYSSLRCVGFSLRWLLLLHSMGSRSVGFSSCGSWALERRLSSCGPQVYLLCGMWDLPGPGIEPVSPTLAGRFLTTVPPGKPGLYFYFFFFIFLFFNYTILGVLYFIFINGCVGSSFLCEGFLQLWQAGATLHHGARASHYRGLSCCGAQAPDAQAQ